MGNVGHGASVDQLGTRCHHSWNDIIAISNVLNRCRRVDMTRFHSVMMTLVFDVNQFCLVFFNHACLLLLYSLLLLLIVEHMKVIPVLHINMMGFMFKDITDGDRLTKMTESFTTALKMSEKISAKEHIIHFISFLLVEDEEVPAFPFETFGEAFRPKFGAGQETCRVRVGKSTVAGNFSVSFARMICLDCDYQVPRCC